MDLRFTEEDEAFRRKVSEFLRSAVPADMAQRTRQGFHTSREDLKRWNRILYEKGWSAPHWPKEYGGTGWSPLHIYLFEDACAAADAPFLSYFGLRLIGPLLYTFGTEEQKKRYLDDILSGETFWCQGFSEPSAGSDLAAVKTTASKEGDGYLINGQKLWTTEAHYAAKMFCLARTDASAKPQKGGLSIFMFDMDQPGVKVRPIHTLDEGHSVNEVFLDNVRVSTEDILGGELGRGWDQAKFLLANERVTNAQAPRSKRELALLKRIAATEMENGLPMLDHPDIRRRIAEIEIDLHALEWSVLRELFESHTARSASVASGLKILGSEIQQRISALAADLVGIKGLAFYAQGGPTNDLPADAPDYLPGLAARQLFMRAATIYAGTNEIQRSIIAKQVFAM